VSGASGIKISLNRVLMPIYINPDPAYPLFKGIHTIPSFGYDTRISKTAPPMSLFRIACGGTASLPRGKGILDFIAFKGYFTYGLSEEESLGSTST
jgi:hypothetical protein